MTTAKFVLRSVRQTRGQRAARNAGRLLVRLSGASAVLVPFASAHADSAYGVCREPADPPGLHAGFAAYDTADTAGNAARLDRESWSLDVEFDLGGAWRTGGAYRGTLLDEEDVGLQTNGYLHSFYYVLHRVRSPGQPLRVSIAPALSASSNVTSDPGEIEADALQLNFAALWRFGAGMDFSWRAGLCADHRFGRYRLYPVVAADWRPNARWQLSPGIPDTIIAYRPAEQLGVVLAVYPNGNEWFVKDKSLTRSSRVEYRAWAADISLEWRTSENIALTATLGRDFEAEYRADLQDGTRAGLELGSTDRVGIALRWNF